MVFRRLCSFLLTALLVGMLVLPAFADGEADKPVLTVASVCAVKNKQVTVPVLLGNAAGLDSLQFRLNYDLATLKLEKAEIGSLLADSGLYVINTDEDGLVALAFASADGLSAAEGEVMLLTFSQYSDYGSALTVSAAYASRYDPATDIQSKAYVDVHDGGVFVGENGTIPAPVITPWPLETPAPTPTPSPSPTPTPLPEPTSDPTNTTESIPTSSRSAGFFSAFSGERPEPGQLFLLCIGLIALAAVIFAIILVLSRRREEERSRPKKKTRQARTRDRDVEAAIRRAKAISAHKRDEDRR